MEDKKVLNHIKKLADEESRLYSKENLTNEEVKELHEMKVELDQCWDLLRQRNALRNAGKNPDQASVRPPNVVENYKQ
jgi:flagellar biosynthesis/type III secretory pathway chaperone